MNYLGTHPAVDKVVERAAVEVRRADAAVDEVDPRFAIDRIIPRSREFCIEPRRHIEWPIDRLRTAARAAENRVAADAAVDRVITRIGKNQIVARIAVD